MKTTPMMFDISQQFFFDAAHTLNREVEGDSSRRIHGHTYHAEVTLSGVPNAGTGMVHDLGLVRRAIEHLRPQLDAVNRPGLGLGQRQDQRRSAMEMPYLGGIHAVPMAAF